MRIRKHEFCALSSSKPWLQWLKTAHIDLFDELIEFHREGHRCSENIAKMTSLLTRIVATRESRDGLVAFLQEYYPYILDDNKTVIKATTASDDVDGVFDHYDPNLLTFPKRLIIVNDNKVKLRESVQAWCAAQGHYDYLIIGNRAYIEYLSPEYSDLHGQIPASNWQVDAFRRKTKVTNNS